MLSLWVVWMASATCGNNRNNAHWPGSSSPHSPSILRSEHTPQIRLRTNSSSSANVRSMSNPSWKSTSLHAGGQGPDSVTIVFCIVLRLGGPSLGILAQQRRVGGGKSPPGGGRYAVWDPAERPP